jgi:drug/metabolite transporter (DMT)-like permease
MANLESNLTNLSNAKTDAPTLPPILFILVAVLLWSTGGLFIKWTTLNAFEVSFYRSLFAVITVAYFTRHEGWGINRTTIVTTFLYAALLLCFVIATKMTTAANAIFLQYTSPVYILIFEPFLFKERFRLLDLATVLICLGGMSLFFVGKLETSALTGNLIALCSGAFMGFYFLLLRLPSSQSVNRAASVIYGSLLLVLVTAPFGIASIPRLTIKDIIAVTFLGVIQIGVAYTLFTLGIARGVRSLEAGIVGYVEPVLNPVWVFLLIGERPSKWAILGGTIIITIVMVHTVLNARAKRERVKVG